MTYKIVYSGKIPSTNTVYASGSWQVRAAEKIKWAKIITTLLLEAKVKPFNNFNLEIKYRTRHDVDNLSILAKYFSDTLKIKYVKDDTSMLFKKLTIEYNEDLPKNTIEFYIDTHD